MENPVQDFLSHWGEGEPREGGGENPSDLCRFA